MVAGDRGTDALDLGGLVVRRAAERIIRADQVAVAVEIAKERHHHATSHGDQEQGRRDSAEEMARHHRRLHCSHRVGDRQPPTGDQPGV
jgi:hypothetical protein